MSLLHKALIVMVGLVLCSNNSRSDDKRTRTFQVNPQHTGVYDTAPMGQLKGLKFVFQTHGPIRSTPTVVDSTVFFGSGDDYFYAINSQSGKELWRFKTGGPIHSSPAVENNVVYFTSRDRILYALNATNGDERWHFGFRADIHYQYGFDYYTSSPTLENNILYVGGGDGYLYAINASSGKLVWEFAAGSPVRDSPAIADGIVVFGTMNGYVIALDKVKGVQLWKYSSIGTTLKFKDFGFDRAAIVSSPSIADRIVTVGSRDGFLYALDLKTGSLKWKFDHEISWAISTPGRLDGKVYCGSSDGRFYQSVDLETGKEEWRFTTPRAVWSSPAIAGNELYFGDLGGHIFGLDRTNGKKIWSFNTSGSIYASPAVNQSIVYCGSDDGCLYAFEGTGEEKLGIQSKRAVFWDYHSGFNYFQNGVDIWVRDYFKAEGYEVVDKKRLVQLMTNQSEDRFPSVVIFAENRFPKEVLGDTSKSALIRRYLDTGGKIVILGPNPLMYVRDSLDSMIGTDFSVPSRVFDIDYPGSDLELKGWYGSRVTPEGTHWGLRGWWVSIFTDVEPNRVNTVLALNESGLASAWVKNYGGHKGTGLVQLWIPKDVHVDLNPIKAAAEYGLE